MKPSRSQRALLEYESILNAAGEGIYGIDANGQATFINQSSIDMLGWSMDDLQGKIVHGAVEMCSTNAAKSDCWVITLGGI